MKHTGVRSILLLIFLFALKEYPYSCGRIIQPGGSGGRHEDDPAPGRSPGPPEVPDDTTVLITSETAYEDCRLRGELAADENNQLNVSVSHPLFKSDVLVPGIVYEGENFLWLFYL